MNGLCDFFDVLLKILISLKLYRKSLAPVAMYIWRPCGNCEWHRYIVRILQSPTSVRNCIFIRVSPEK